MTYLAFEAVEAPAVHVEAPVEEPHVVAPVEEHTATSTEEENTSHPSSLNPVIYSHTTASGSAQPLHISGQTLGTIVFFSLPIIIIAIAIYVGLRMRRSY